MLRNERGGTLIGTLVALTIMSTALAIMIGGLFSSGSGVVVVNQQVGAQALARQQMELVKADPYAPNPTAVPYTRIADTGGFTSTLTVTYWDPASATFVSTRPGTDSGLQRISVAIYATSDASRPALVLQDLKRR
jgi:type II secretory pathway pseudopilin PulG